MTSTTSKGLHRSAKLLPPVVIILPLHNMKQSATHISDIILKLAQQITEDYGITEAGTIIEKLNHAISLINYDSNKKTVLIHLSSFDEKIIYLDVPLDERIIVDEPFEIRDLANSIIPIDKYLLLVQSAREFGIFLGNSSNLLRIKVNIENHIAAYRNDIAEKSENFSDANDRNETLLDKFIHHIDKELSSILNKYKLPVFVVGTERMNGHFKKFTHNSKAIVDYIHGNFDSAEPHEIINVIRPYLHELQEIENAELAVKIEEAKGMGKLSFGIDDVWKNAAGNKGKLLLVERNYSAPNPGKAIDAEHRSAKTCDVSDFVKDAVDVIIERVLEHGGEVKFVEPDVLKNLEHIALFLYY